MSARKQRNLKSLIRKRQIQSLPRFFSGGGEVFETKESRLCFLLVFRIKTLQKPLRDNCFKNENNSLPRFFFGAVVGVFLQRLNYIRYAKMLLTIAAKTLCINIYKPGLKSIFGAKFIVVLNFLNRHSQRVNFGAKI
ncbi:MAG: hypothetical protein PWQ06_2780 [Anaerophaga sp.]|nr:hypothetical protein [Anaerophaga sp.]